MAALVVPIKATGSYIWNVKFLGKRREDIYGTIGRHDKNMGGLRDRRKYTPEHVSRRYRLSHPDDIPGARRDIRGDVGRGGGH